MILILVYQNLELLVVLALLRVLPAQEVGVFTDKLLDEVFGALSLALAPLVQDGLEQPFVKFSHRSESCASVKKVKFLVILFSLVAGPVGTQFLGCVALGAQVLEGGGEQH